MTAARQYINKYGHKYSAAIFKNWDQRIIEFMEIRPVRRTAAEVAEDKAACARLRDSK